MQPEGSLYEDQGVGHFHKPLDYSRTKGPSNPKLLFNDQLNTADIVLSTPEVTSLLTGVETSLITSQAPSRFLRENVTTEQEMYARGFLEALDELSTNGNRQPEALAPSDLKLTPSSSNIVMLDTSLARSVHHHSSQELVSSSQYMSGPNPSLEAVAPTYVTATMDYIPNIPAPISHSEPPSRVYAASTNSFTPPNAYSPPVINHFTSMLDYNGYSAPPASSHSQQRNGMGSDNSGLPTQMMKELRRVVPADIKTQEQMKVERKKARNRIAASKCRLRRLQRESELQGKVRVLRDHNQELNHEVTGLKVQIGNLKKALLRHMKGGCHVNLPDGYGLRSDSCSSAE